MIVETNPMPPAADAAAPPVRAAAEPVKLKRAEASEPAPDPARTPATQAAPQAPSSIVF
jgi:hypothetical protein